MFWLEVSLMLSLILLGLDVSYELAMFLDIVFVFF